MNKNPYSFSIQDIKGRIDEDGETHYDPLPFRLRERGSEDEGDPPIKPNQTWSIYGKRGTGKTIFCEWFLDHVRDLYPWGWVFTKTQNNKFWEQHIPKSKILGPYNAYNLNAIISRQKEMEALYLKYGKFNPCAFVIWDDALGDEIKYDNDLHTYYFNSRHFQTLNIMTAQHVTGTPPAIRQNTDFGVIFKNENLPAIKHLTEDFSSADTWHSFSQTMNKYTMDRNFLVVNNDPNVDKQHKLYTGKAEIIEEPFVMGCEQYWRDSYPQYQKIISGKAKEEREKIKVLSEIPKMVKLFNISNPGRQIDRI